MDEFRETFGGVQSAAKFYTVFDAMMCPIALLEGRLAA